MKRLQLMLVDAQSLFREALRTLLGLQPDFEIVAEAENGERAVALAKTHRPDVILMDLRMPVMGGVEATRRVLAAVPAARVVVLTTFEEDEEIFEAMRAGALGYLLKACSAEKLCGSVRAAAQGTSVLEPSVAARMMAELNRLSTKEGKRTAQALADPLSERELAVLKLLADGCSNKEIGSRLNITEGTVKNHMTNVLGKLGVLDRTQAALKARELGYL
ncbi:MAG: response regulator transcription factor [Verrucomicrobia bacterium]|nr:response regulator transcription factor [Verrucomicrobiota bacterium]